MLTFRLQWIWCPDCSWLKTQPMWSSKDHWHPVLKEHKQKKGTSLLLPTTDLMFFWDPNMQREASRLQKNGDLARRVPHEALWNLLVTMAQGHATRWPTKHNKLNRSREAPTITNHLLPPYTLFFFSQIKGDFPDRSIAAVNFWRIFK